MDDLHYFTIKDATEMFDIYEECLDIKKKNKSSSKKYIGASGLLNFVRGD